MALRETQLTLARWIRSPEGVAKALSEEDARSKDGAPGTSVRRLESLIRGDDALDASGRLEIYANAYFYRILGVLGTDYPALQGALGSQAFNDLVTSYLLVEPSRHASLRYAGARVADFLSTGESASGIRGRAPWAANLADFEWARAEVFDAPDGALLGREALIAMQPEQLGSLRLKLGPWVRLRAFEYPVDQLWRTGIRAEKFESESASASASMLIWRRDEEVLHRCLDSSEGEALALARSGVCFAELCEWAAGQVGDNDAPALAAGWLEAWIADGLLWSVDPG